MARNKKLINNAENHLVVGSLEVLGDVSGGNIQTIKRSVDNLQTSYTKVAARQKDFWSALSEDSLITPIEKIQLKKEWECIDLTYTTIYSEASDRNVLDTSTIIAYINAYSNLRTYLFTTLGLFDEMSENTEIADRNVFNTYFSNYYACENLVQTALVIGTIEALDFVTVGTLDEDGNEGDVVIYQGEFYQWVNGRWKKIGTNGYCGCLTSLPTEIDGNYFLAADNFSGAVALKSPEGKYYIAPENKRYTSFRYFEKAFIYEYMNGQWNKITDEYDYKYIVAFSDYYNLTGKMPAVWQNSLDELADGISGLNTLFTQQAQLIESYRAAIWGNLAVQETSIQQQILNSNENISTLDGKYDDLDELTEQFLSDYYISDEELGTIAAKYAFTPQEYEAMKASVDSINGDLSLIHSVYSQTKAILDTYKTASLTDEVIAKDIQNILSDQQVTTAELEALQTKYSLSTADYNSLTALFTSYNETATNFAKALVILQTKNGVSEAEINAMLGNLTAAQYAAMIAQYGTDINGLTTEIARKIEHIPVYLGMVQNEEAPLNIQEGDWYLWNGVERNSYYDATLQLKKGWVYKRTNYKGNSADNNNHYFTMLNPADTTNSNYFMTALKDMLTQSNVIASQAFCVLWANAFYANAAVLNALKVTTIEIADGGLIETEDYTAAGNSGFLLDGETGKAYLNDVIAKGEIYATTGSFTGEVHALSGSFTGEVNATSGSFSGKLTCESLDITNLQPGNKKLFGILSAAGSTTEETTATIGRPYTYKISGYRQIVGSGTVRYKIDADLSYRGCTFNSLTLKIYKKTSENSKTLLNTESGNSTGIFFQGDYSINALEALYIELSLTVTLNSDFDGVLDLDVNAEGVYTSAANNVLKFLGDFGTNSTWRR